MRKSILLPSVTLLAALASGAFVLPAAGGDARGTPVASEAWLPLAEVVRRLEAAGYRNIEKIEREHGVYEARATDRDGARVKLYVHPQNGEITLRSERRELARAHERAADGTRLPECTKRRCRDDLPPPAPAR